MAYKALYRKYRPSTFEEVAGQQHVVKTLKNALASGKLSHAYLFAGPRGTGKTSMAKLLAKALNCDRGIGCQCNECKNCQAIIDGSHPDVLELDAASNNGVDEIRELIDKVKYGCILGRYKVYIIDEVHMLSSGAFNALLKTLEEPPEHVIFILATTEPHKILPTILSRCQRYDFTRVSNDDIKERIKVILLEEGIEYNEEAINLIISLADGGMRDALSILDQVLAYTGGTLSVEDVLNIFALESKEEKIALINSIVEGNLVDVLDRLNHYIARGTDIKRLTDDLLVILKDVLIYQTTRIETYLESLNEDEAMSLARKIDNKRVIEMVEALMNTVKEYKTVSAINPLFEVTLLKLTTISGSSLPPVEPIVKNEPKNIKNSAEHAQNIEKAVFKPEEKPIEVVPEKKAPEVDQMSLFEAAKEEPPAPIILSDDVLILKHTEKDTSFYIDDDLMIDIMVASKKGIKNELLGDWPKMKRLLAHPTLGKAASLIIDGHPLVAHNKILIVEVPLAKSAEKINDKNNQKDLQDVIFNAFGKKMFIYGVSRNDSVRLQQRYMNLSQLSKLPKPADITLEFEGDK